ncbi:MAG TPA: radical SAM protein [bacterium]|nr:radical SAM protein [bacterium]
MRTFSLERIKAELELFEKHNISQVFVLDPTFNKNRERAKKILKMITQTAPEIHFTFEVRTEFLDREMAKLFKSVNCGLQIGLQSSDPAVLSNVNRFINPSNFKEKIKILNSENIVFGLDLIYGLPGDTLAGHLTLKDFVKHFRPQRTDVVTYNSNGESIFTALDPKWARLLRKFNGENTLSRVIEALKLQYKGEVAEFIEFCISSGILEPS